MPTDYQKLSENLRKFYDFAGKTVIYIGAAGRQLLDPATPPKKLIAIDKDANALQELKAIITTKGLQGSVDVVAAEFEEVTVHGDVIYFEFCLHEMDDPDRALKHAKSLGDDVVVYDHSPGSAWVFHCAEEDKVARSCAAMERIGIRQRERYQAEQWFGSHAELLAKVGTQGEVAIERARRFAEASKIAIPMSYELNLL